MSRACVLPLLLLTACAVTERQPPIQPPLVPESVDLIINDDTIGALPPLNVAVSVFESAQYRAGSLYDSAARVGSVERRYIPYLLKETLDRAGFWGAVRVMPRSDPSAELNITGRILFSDGVELNMSVRAEDATGRIWIDRVYRDLAGDPDYATDPNYKVDPFQDLYDEIANDLLEVQLTGAEHAEIIDVGTVRYGRELSPESFSKYVTVVAGRHRLTGLPSLQDPLFQRVRRIRESEYLFADGVDAHYESLHRRLGPVYAWWRHYSYELITGNRRLEGIDATRGATRGSWYAMERIYKTYRESRMNEDALRELTASFDRETAPTVTEVAGRVVELSGTLDDQYREWRRLLRELYRRETGGQSPGKGDR